MEIIAKLEIENIEPVILGYQSPEYIVSFGEKKVSFDYFNDAQDCFKDFSSEAFDQYR